MTITRRTCLASLAAAIALPAAAKGGPPLMLARQADSGIDPSGFLVSEKYDGVRAVWDGRALRFRSGLPVAAPAWFLSRLPAQPLDGELWLGRGRFEALSGVVRKAVPVDAEWGQLNYQVFDLPGAGGPFTDRAARIAILAHQLSWAQVAAVEQSPLADRTALQRRFDAVVRGGGEGLVLHRTSALWRPGRSDDLLKLKPLHDAEAVVTAHLAGHGKHAGRLGALRVRNEEGLEFLVGTGYSDVQRQQPPALGTRITYTHRGLTASGVPRFASFLRKHEV